MTEALRISWDEAEKVKYGTINNEFSDQKICYWKEKDGTWSIYFPGYGVGWMAKHTITDHEDGTITASPSVLMESRRGTKHGFLEHGVWRDV